MVTLAVDRLKRKISVKTNHLSLRVVHGIKKTDDNSSLPQFTCLVSKKLDKRATRRNRTKRLIYEAIRQHSSKLKPGFKLTISARRIFWKEKLQDILPEVEQLLRKAGLLKEEI